MTFIILSSLWLLPDSVIQFPYDYAYNSQSWPACLIAVLVVVDDDAMLTSK